MLMVVLVVIEHTWLPPRDKRILFILFYSFREITSPNGIDGACAAWNRSPSQLVATEASSMQPAIIVAKANDQLNMHWAVANSKGAL